MPESPPNSSRNNSPSTFGYLVTTNRFSCVLSRSEIRWLRRIQDRSLCGGAAAEFAPLLILDVVCTREEIRDDVVFCSYLVSLWRLVSNAGCGVPAGTGT